MNQEQVRQAAVDQMVGIIFRREEQLREIILGASKTFPYPDNIAGANKRVLSDLDEDDE